MNNQWIQSTNNFYIREVSQNVEKLPKGVYKVEETPQGELYLEQVMTEYTFPYKVYGIESNFINRVVKTYYSTTGNLGVIMNGVKGTGKTVTAKQICNKLELPVILIHRYFDNIPTFINKIQQDVIVFVDEFEKVYDRKDTSVLTIMDGAMDNGSRKVFLLTTNELYINDNMIQRPGRIRYLKTYGQLSLEAITEIVDDKLIHRELRKEVIDFISQLETITVDIVGAVVQEVNIHQEDPKVFGDVFNIKVMDSKYNVYELIPGKATPIELARNVRINPLRFEQSHIDSNTDFTVGGGIGDLGRIINVLDESTVTTEEWHYNEEGNKEVKIIRTFTIEEVKQYRFHAF